MMKAIKRLLDVIGSVVLLIVLCPVLLLIAILIKIDSAGSIFFIQRRLGLYGVEFNMFKFRTMVTNAEQIGTGLFSYENDPRITKFGKMIRSISLDELPQLLNVFLGDMSLVGPRPPVVYELGNYSDFDASLKYRFVMKPGITGLSQVSGRNDLDWTEKIVYDRQYIENFKKIGILEDIRILLKTISVILSMDGVIEKRKI